MRARKLGLSLAALMFLSPFVAACSGDEDDPDSPETGENGAETGDDGGDGGSGGAAQGEIPDEPSNRMPECPFTAKQLGKELDLTLKGGDGCVFTEKKKSALRISVTTSPAAENDGFEEKLGAAEDWPNMEELDVDGEGFVAWSDDNLNILVGYLDNGGEYSYALSAVEPEQVGAEDPVALAEQLIAFTVESRPAIEENLDPVPTDDPEDEEDGGSEKSDKPRKRDKRD